MRDTRLEITIFPAGEPMQMKDPTGCHLSAERHRDRAIIKPLRVAGHSATVNVRAPSIIRSLSETASFFSLDNQTENGQGAPFAYPCPPILHLPFRVHLPANKAPRLPKRPRLQLPFQKAGKSLG